MMSDKLVAIVIEMVRRGMPVEPGVLAAVVAHTGGTITVRHS